MTADAHTDAQRRVLLVNMLRARQAACLAAVLGFGLLAAAVDDAWMWDLLVMLVVFTGIGFAVWVAARWIPAGPLLLTTVAVDIALIAITIARTPYAPELTMAFVAVITAASIALSTRAAVLATAEAIALGLGAVAVFGDDDQLAPMAAAMIMLSTVAIVLIGMRREERRTRHLLERSERQLQRAETVAGMGSWQWCPSTNELIWSPNMFRMLGQDPASRQPDYDEWTSNLPPEALKVMQDHARHTLETGEDYAFDSGQRLPSGDRMVIQARGSRVFDADGVAWLVGTAQDVTELRRVEDLKDEFVATASHELRTPATIVLGFVRTLDDRWEELDDPTRRTLVTELRRGGERMSQLIEDVLSVARIEHGDLHVELSPIGIREAISSLVGELDNPRVAVDVDPAIDAATVLVDQERLRQVVYNLVENALRYDPEGGPVKVQVGPSGEDTHHTHVLVRVRDHGPGVAPHERERIFGRFVRGSSSSRSDSGTGLGLYVARSLVERQGGTLWLEDPVDGAGCVFGFTILRA